MPDHGDCCGVVLMQDKKKDKILSYPKLSKAQEKAKKELFARPVNQIDLTKVKNIGNLLDNYAGMSVQARNLGKCAAVLKNMLADKKRPTILLGIAGPLIAGGLRKVIRDLIEYNIVDVVVSTGAIIYQDIYQARGYQHYLGSPSADDKKLRELLIDRIYDTYVDEEKFWGTDCWVSQFADTLEPKNYSSREFLSKLAQNRLKDKNSILYTANKRGVPIFVPALNDSSIGIGLTEHYHRMRKAGGSGVTIDAIRDNYELTQIVANSPCTAAIYIAGGVPKNYINDSVVMSYIFGVDTGGHKYALQLTADSPHWGGLSGSTLDEATSWGKINPKATRAMAFVEPTASLPLLAYYAISQKLGNNRKRIRFDWEEDILNRIAYK